eukprot:gene17800-biopygen5585
MARVLPQRFSWPLQVRACGKCTPSGNASNPRECRGTPEKPWRHPGGNPGAVRSPRGRGGKGHACGEGGRAAAAPRAAGMPSPSLSLQPPRTEPGPGRAQRGQWDRFRGSCGCRQHRRTFRRQPSAPRAAAAAGGPPLPAAISYPT